MGKKSTPTNVETPPEGLDNIADTIADELPEENQFAIDQATVEAGAEQGSTDIQLDELGVPWNPQDHATGPDGKGVKKGDGTWRKRRKGTKSFIGGAPGPKPEAEPAQDDTAQRQQSVNREVQARQSAIIVSRMLVQLCIGIGGEDFIPRDLHGPGGTVVNEQLMLDDAWGNYFVAKDFADLPPGFALLGAIGMYALPRFQMPRTKERVEGFFDGITRRAREGWAYMKGRRSGMKPYRKCETIEGERVVDPP